MLQVLDKYRKEYEEVTGKPYDELDKNASTEYLRVPTWEYVCWLENKLAKHEGAVEETPYTITTASTIEGAKNGTRD